MARRVVSWVILALTLWMVLPTDLIALAEEAGGKISIQRTPDESVAPETTDTSTSVSSTDAVALEMTDEGIWIETASSRSAFGNVAPEAYQAMADDGLNANFSFSGVQTLRGIFSSIGLYITLPEYASMERAVLRVSYTCSDLILEHLSSLTFYMNGTPFYSCPVAYQAGGPTVLYVEVPLDLFVDAFNFLEIGGYVRLTDDEGCIDDYMGANWININEETNLRVSYTLTEDENTLAYYPYPFVSIANDTGDGLSVAISDAMTDSELEAALLIMANLGDELSDPNEVHFGAFSQVDNDRMIVISLFDNLPETYKELVTSQDIPPEGTYIRRLKHKGKDTLLVVSYTGDGLMEAARLLGDNDRVRQLDTDRHVVYEGEAALKMLNATLSDAIVQGQYTLKEIVGRGISFTGPFHQEVTVYLPVPSDYMLSLESKFSLRFRYSTNLDFTRSLVTVFWGDIPMASKKLSPEGAAGDTLTFVPPVDLSGMTGSFIRIAFELEVQDLICTPRQTNMPWAYVSEDSTIFLPMGRAGALNLSNRPAPFQREGRLNDVMAVISDTPSAQELLLLGRTMSMLGVSSDSYGTLKVVRASDFDPNNANYNIVAIGTGQSSVFLQTVNDQLHFKYDSLFDQFASNEKLVMDTQFARSIGAVQLMRSPYGEDRAILTLSAANSEGLNRLIKLVSVEKLRWTLTDDAVIIDSKDKTTAYQFQTTQIVVTEEKPSFIENLTSESGQGALFTLVAVGIMLVLLLSVALVLLRIRMRKKGDE